VLENKQLIATRIIKLAAEYVTKRVESIAVYNLIFCHVMIPEKHVKNYTLRTTTHLGTAFYFIATSLKRKLNKSFISYNIK
jgi:hypothetical protein